MATLDSRLYRGTQSYIYHFLYGKKCAESIIFLGIRFWFTKQYDEWYTCHQPRTPHFLNGHHFFKKILPLKFPCWLTRASDRKRDRKLFLCKMTVVVAWLTINSRICTGVSMQSITVSKRISYLISFASSRFKHPTESTRSCNTVLIYQPYPYIRTCDIQHKLLSSELELCKTHRHGLQDRSYIPPPKTWINNGTHLEHYQNLEKNVKLCKKNWIVE